MADEIKISGLPEKTTIAETDFLVGNVGTSDDATGRVTISALRTRLNNANQSVTGNIEASGNIKAATLEGNGALITGVIAAGTGGSSSTGSLTLACNSDNSTPAAKVTLSKYTTDLVDIDETGVRPKTGIPYSHDDAAIPFDKDLDLQNKYLFKSQTIQDLQPFQAAVGNGSDSDIVVPDNINLQLLDQDATIRFPSFKTPVGRDYSTGGGGLYSKRRFSNDGIQLQIGTDNKLTAVYDSGVSVTITSDDVVNDGKWHTPVIEYDRSGVMRMFLDGTLQADTATIDNISLVGPDVHFFNKNGTESFFDGSLNMGFAQFNYSIDYSKELSSNPLKAIDPADEGGSNVAQNVSNCENGLNGAGVSNIYDTFSGVSPSGFSATKTTTGTGNKVAGTNDEIQFIKGKKYLFYFNLLLNSGVAPSFVIVPSLGASKISEESIQVASAGVNSFVFTATETTVGAGQIFSLSDDSSDFVISNLDVHQLGCTASFKPQDIISDKDGNAIYWKDSSGNGNHGSATNVKVSNRSEQLTQTESEFVAALTCGTSGTVTLNTSFDTLRETKQGSIVHVSGEIKVLSVSSPLGNLILSGFTNKISAKTETSENISGSVTCQTLASAATGSLGLSVISGTNTIGICDGFNGTGAVGNDFANHMQAGTILTFNFWYLTED